MYNRPAVNQSLEFSRCPHHFLMMKTWPGLTHGPPQPGIASLKVRTYAVIYIVFHQSHTLTATYLLTFSFTMAILQFLKKKKS